MTTPQPESYAPRSPSVVDSIVYNQRVVESILRNNPLTDAVVSEGLLKWVGNYTDGGGNKINFLWIGEFLPADPNLGNVSQRGFSLVRDDSRGGVSAIALYDANPTGSPGLKQTLFITSGDGKRLMTEAREGGQAWPEFPAMMVPTDPLISAWPTTTSATYQTLGEGRANIIGNNLHYRMWAATDTGATGDFRVRVAHPSGPAFDISGTVHSLAANANAVLDSFFDVSSLRGQTVQIFYEAKRSNAVGNVRGTPIQVSCYTG